MKPTIVVDLGFGDSGKGTLVDFFARREEEIPLVIRFNGGAQAGHNVVTSDGQHHEFAQFGAAYFAGAPTYLSRFMLIDPIAMDNEAKHLTAVGFGNPYHRLYIDRECMVVTPYHKAANRMREIARGDDRHGSCGMGIGEAMSQDLEHPELTIRAGDLVNFLILMGKLCRQCDWLYSNFPDADHLAVLNPAVVSDQLRVNLSRLMIIDRNHIPYRGTKNSPLNLIFEGAQGVLLDQDYGFFPNTTWSRTGFQNAETILLDDLRYDEERVRIGVMRSYMTRHGNGLFPTEEKGLINREPHNPHNEWQGSFRVGHFDALLARYALDVTGGIDQLAITHLDAKLSAHKIATAYEYPYDEVRFSRITDIAVPLDPNTRSTCALGRFIEMCRPVYEERNNMTSHLHLIEQQLGMKASILSYGPTAHDKEMSIVGT